ncbi:uncharacterized protein LOC8082488 [Sorghum bicolor]|uniref:uncharacterized protein LOC8082488 n=1 Tax=Sorghum bicolor TaxID=4558 RepID=UPI000B4268DD|nr:uncharacterized protein LOC8082488 [Sorghum bicolor]|eukprot:XP_021312672.1 uncharacterized protein LOC8082488 [Sorghum bicolor]
MGRPEALLGLVPFGPARHENRPTGRAWAVRQARWPVETRPGGTQAIRARVGPCRSGQLLIFTPSPSSGQNPPRTISTASQLPLPPWKPSSGAPWSGYPPAPLPWTEPSPPRPGSPRTVRTASAPSPTTSAGTRNIVSRLPVKDAVRTTALATRWRRVWHSTPLVIYDSHLDPDDEPARVAATDRVLSGRAPRSVRHRPPRLMFLR